MFQEVQGSTDGPNLLKRYTPHIRVGRAVGSVVVGRFVTSSRVVLFIRSFFFFCVSGRRRPWSRSRIVCISCFDWLCFGPPASQLHRTPRSFDCRFFIFQKIACHRWTKFTGRVRHSPVQLHRVSACTSVPIVVWAKPPRTGDCCEARVKLSEN